MMAFAKILEEEDQFPSPCDSELFLEESSNAMAASFRYPPHLLGTSWGSYLFHDSSRLDNNGGGSADKDNSASRSSATARKAVQLDTTPHQLDERSSALGGAASAAPSRGILRTPKQLHVNEPRPLTFSKVLAAALHRGATELRGSGFGVAESEALCGPLSLLRRELGECPEVDSLTPKMQGCLVSYFKSTLDALTASGKRFMHKEVSLQEAEERLCRKQIAFVKEQDRLQSTLENQRLQQLIEQENLKKLKVELIGLKEKVICNPTKKPSGHAEFDEMQRQQTKLEKMLMAQQREFQKLQNIHDLTKRELAAAKDTVHLLQQKLTSTTQKARKASKELSFQVKSTRHTLAKTTQELKMEKIKKQEVGIQKTRPTAGVKTVRIKHRELEAEINKMKKELSDQQRRERELRRESQKSNMAGPLSHKHSSTVLRKRNKVIPGSEKLPKVELHNPHHKHQKNDSKFSSKVPILPHLAVGSVVPLPRPSDVITSADQKLPDYSFTAAELLSLADFEDSESAKQVLRWLRQQGTLQH